MSKTRILPEQAKNLEVFDDQKAVGATLETAPINLEEFLGGVISQFNRLLNTTTAGNDWHADLTAPSTFENGAKRGVNALNQQLHDLERKRLLTVNPLLTDIAITAGTNVHVLTVGQLPGNLTAAVGVVETLGTVVAAHTGTFGAHSLDVVAGVNTLNPKNIIPIVEESTRSAVTSEGRRVFGLMQTENATDGHTMLSNTPNGVQLSFVRCNVTGNGFEACPVAHIGGKVISYAYIERIGLEDFDEQVLLLGLTDDSGAELGAGGTSSRIYSEAVTGTINGANTVFTTAQKFEITAGLTPKVYFNGQLLIEGATEDYVVSEAVPTAGYETLTFAFAPITGDVIRIDYAPDV